MQGRNLILLGAAIAIGLLAVLLANSYFSGVEQRQERIAEQQQLQRIVVVSQDVGFGTPLNEANLKLVNWPAASVPEGAFTSIAAAARGNRVALRPIVTGEPVLASKISGADGRAVLSANLPAGKLAYTVPISEVSGVGGFVRPGDVVDVLVTRAIPGEGTTPNDKMTDMVLEAVPVLGVDQVADEKSTKPVPAKTATLEVDSFGAQKLALSIQLGTLSLALRNVADLQTAPRATVIPRHLSATDYYIRDRSAARAAAPSAAPARPAAPQVASNIAVRPRGPTMTVVRGVDTTEYEVFRGW